MFTPSPDYMQQLFTYLQAGQQLLAQWTALGGAPTPPTIPAIPPSATSGGQFTPPMPFMAPPMPFTAQPAPSADYAQQLFSQLQAWRQYLEQTAGAAPQSPPTSPAASALGALLGDQPQPHSHQSGKGGPDVPIKPGGSKGTQQSDSGTASFKLPPDVIPPGNKNSTQLPDGKQPILIRPSNPGGNQIDFPLRELRLEDVAAPVQGIVTPTAGTAFQSALSRVDTQASPQLDAKSLFGRSSLQDSAANLRDLGENPTR